MHFCGFSQHYFIFFSFHLGCNYTFLVLISVTARPKSKKSLLSSVRVLPKTWHSIDIEPDKGQPLSVPPFVQLIFWFCLTWKLTTWFGNETTCAHAHNIRKWRSTQWIVTGQNLVSCPAVHAPRQRTSGGLAWISCHWNLLKNKLRGLRVCVRVGCRWLLKLKLDDWNQEVCPLLSLVTDLLMVGNIADYLKVRLYNKSSSK